MSRNNDQYWQAKRHDKSIANKKKKDYIVMKEESNNETKPQDAWKKYMEEELTKTTSDDPFVSLAWMTPAQLAENVEQYAKSKKIVEEAFNQLDDELIKAPKAEPDVNHNYKDYQPFNQKKAAIEYDLDEPEDPFAVEEDDLDDNDDGEDSDLEEEIYNEEAQAADDNENLYNAPPSYPPLPLNDGNKYGWTPRRFQYSEDSLIEALTGKNGKSVYDEVLHEEEVIINAQELAQHFATEQLKNKYQDFTVEKYAKEFEESTYNYNKLILTFKRNKNEA